MNQGKYIIVTELGCDVAIVFDEIIDHSTVAKGFNKVLAAGFFNISIDDAWAEKDEDRQLEISVYGKSTTLDIGSRGDDDQIAIERVLRL